MSSTSRRGFLQLAGAAGLAGENRPPVRALTRGPRYHWFGYYDKLQFDPSSRYALANEVDFEHRSPTPGDVIRVGVVDTGRDDQWRELGTSSAWNWQQGCMLQWIPGAGTSVLWNDRAGDRFVCHILEVGTGARRTIAAPVYALSPDGRWGVRPDFRRLNDTRPGYGYAGIPDPRPNVPAPDDDGLWRVDLATGREELIFSFAAAARIPFERPAGIDLTGAAAGVNLARSKHWFNHLLVSPDGARLILLHRWRGPGDRNYLTRMFTIRNDGTDPYILDPYGKTSHFIWRDPQTVLAWAWHPSHAWGFYLYTDKTSHVELVGGGVMTENGHCTYLPGNQWILNDTYPDKAKREQHVYLYHVASGRRVPLGSFPSPPEYTGEWRCDTHPRFSPDGRMVTIDSPHRGGRQVYLIDISAIAG